MKIITINLPIQYLEAIQSLIELERYPSRSEVIRIALQEFLESEQEFDIQLQPEIFKRQMEALTP